MEQRDIRLRNATYQRFVELGRAPTVTDVAEATSLSVEEVGAGWRRLHEAHALVIDLETSQLLMANPFAGRQTSYQVDAGDHSWFANCAWDAFGIGAALGLDSVVKTLCPDCSDPIRLSVTDALPDDESSIFHVLVPAARWWDDITHT
ncbi:MAG TPA: organomercurial lyase [Acidimicrobiia bacterium]|nr:organomercurial lyase [Acidimicrobiia bacterium]